MRNLEIRLSRLEGRTTGASWLYVVEAPDGECDPDAFLRSQGHEVGRDDLIVRITRFAGDCDGPRLISAAPR